MIPTPETLTRANSIIQQIEDLQAELVGLFASATTTTGKRRGRPPGSGRAVAVANGVPVRRRRMSSEGRARIAAGAKARWAKLRTDQGTSADNDAPATDPIKPARKASGMSESGRAAIAAAQKARWAKVRAEKKKASKT